jgi:hypothetical protein
MTGDARNARTIETPVAIFLYNRAEHASRLLSHLEEAPLRQLFVIADGPKDAPEDAARCREVREVVESARLPYQVHHLYADTNLGCSARISSGVTQVFSQAREAIFLEEDCLPALGFYSYCEELLRRYRDHDQVMMISGLNPLSRWRERQCDYFFSTLGNAQAWASWERAWRFYDPRMSLWREPTVRKRVEAFIADPEQFAHRSRINDRAAGRGGVWDYRWAFARQARGGLSVVPTRNHVLHLGRGQEATHVRHEHLLDYIADCAEPRFPLRPPDKIEADRSFDRTLFEATTGRASLATAKRLARRLLEKHQRLRAAALLRQVAKSEGLDEEAERLLTSSIREPD